MSGVDTMTDYSPIDLLVQATSVSQKNTQFTPGTSISYANERFGLFVLVHFFQFIF